MKGFYAIIALTIFLFACTPVQQLEEHSLESFLGPNAELRAYSISDIATGKAHLAIPFLDYNENRLYLSALADLDNDGTFETQIARNAHPRVRKSYENTLAFSYSGNLPETVKIAVWLTDSPITNLDAAFATKTFNARVETIDVDTVIALSAPGASEDLKRGAFIPIVSALEDGDYQQEGNVPDLEGGPMDCFPIATANNLISLTQANGERDRLPSDPKEMIDEMKQDMQYKDGVLIQNYQAGKQAFIDRHRLPIITTRTNRPTPEQIADALGNGCAVEISTALIQSPTKPNNGHVLTGVGISADGDDIRLLVHDPATKGQAGGDVYSLTQSQGTVLTVIKDYPFWDGVMIIDAMFVQCWDNNLAIKLGVDLQSDDAPATSVNSPTFGEGKQTIDTLVIGGKHYPKTQFRIGSHVDKGCGKDHWHADGKVYSVETPETGITDPQPNNCGFGAVGEVPEEKFSLTEQQAIKWIGSLLIE